MDFARKTLSQVGHCMSCSEDLLGPPEVEVEGRLEGAGFDDEEGRLKREARSLPGLSFGHFLKSQGEKN